MAANILAIDDSKVTRKLLTYILEGEGYDVITAENGIDALEKIRSYDISAIITDLNMPQMDGLEFIRTIRENEDYCKVPILLLTTEGEERGKKMGLEAGADAYLSKPIEPDPLLAALKKIIIN